jgi:hypothetical protein
MSTNRNTDPDSRFLDYWEGYMRAKARNDTQEMGRFALMCLAHIHGNNADQTHAAEELHRLVGLLLTDEQSREMYDELRADSGIDGVRRSVGVRPVTQ